ncbi:MAG: PAS domain-containing protein [Proteobacteria bacterium]|jgi:rsbT co-antagonist protein RsbR|nr:PAS domain-containing protein [Pseudomonadota bacterium]
MLQKLEIAHSILDEIPVGIFWKDRNSVYLGCNLWHAKVAGISAKDIVGKTDYDMPWSAMADKYISNDKQVITSQKKLDIVQSITINNNEEKWWRLTKLPLLVDGKVSGVLAIWQDITEIKDILDSLLSVLSACVEKSNKINKKLENYKF